MVVDRTVLLSLSTITMLTSVSRAAEQQSTRVYAPTVHDKQPSYWNLHLVDGAVSKMYLTYITAISLDLKVMSKNHRPLPQTPESFLLARQVLLIVRVP